MLEQDQQTLALALVLLHLQIEPMYLLWIKPHYQDRDERVRVRGHWRRKAYARSQIDSLRCVSKGIVALTSYDDHA